MISCLILLAGLSGNVLFYLYLSPKFVLLSMVIQLCLKLSILVKTQTKIVTPLRLFSNDEMTSLLLNSQGEPLLFKIWGLLVVNQNLKT